MFWALIFMSIFPIFELDKFTRRDIRKYNREIKRIRAAIKNTKNNVGNDAQKGVMKPD